MTVRETAKDLMRTYYDTLTGSGVRDNDIVALLKTEQDKEKIPDEYKGFKVVKEVVGTLKLMSWK